MRISPNHEFQKIAPLRPLTKTHKNVKDNSQTTLTFSAPNAIATMLLTLAFISNICRNIQYSSPNAFVAVSEVAFLTRL